MSDISVQNYGVAGSLADPTRIVAMFETNDLACKARDALVSAGIDHSKIQILAKSTAAKDASFPYDHSEEGIWGAIRGMLMPDEDSHFYAEGIRRGHSMLAVRSGQGDVDRIERLLEEQGAMDVDEHSLE